MPSGSTRNSQGWVLWIDGAVVRRPQDVEHLPRRQLGEPADATCGGALNERMVILLTSRNASTARVLVQSRNGAPVQSPVANGARTGPLVPQVQAPPGAGECDGPRLAGLDGLAGLPGTVRFGRHEVLPPPSNTVEGT